MKRNCVAQSKSLKNGTFLVIMLKKTHNNVTLKTLICENYHVPNLSMTN